VSLKPKLQANGPLDGGHILSAQASHALAKTQLADGSELIRHRFSLLAI
jgi:hypothetical protein